METTQQIINERFLDLLDRLAKKDKKAWDFFVDQYTHLIYNYVIKTFQRYHYCFQMEEVEDICHRVLLALLDHDCQRLKNFKGENEYTFIAYLRAICFHMTIDFLREQKRFVRLEDMHSHASDHDHDDALDQKDLKALISTLKDHLSDRHRYLFKLIYEEEWEMPEVAKIMHLTLNAAHQLKFRMIGQLIKIAKEKDLYHHIAGSMQLACA